MPNRCSWPKTDLSLAYHDTEWGVPLHDDRKLFEFLIWKERRLDLAGNDLNKRNSYRAAFDQFNAKKVAGYDQQKIQQLLLNPGIIRNRLKVAAAIQNAKAFIAVQKESAALTNTLAICRRPSDQAKARGTSTAQTPLSEALSKDSPGAGSVCRPDDLLRVYAGSG